MPTSTSANLENERPTRRRAADREPSSLKKTAAKAVTPETLIDLVQRLGVVDIVIDRLRARLESTDVDNLLDEIGDYIRRHPEVIVVGMATLTVAAGAVVFLSRYNDEDEEEEVVEEIVVPPQRPRKRA
ncbi:MAG: hypothetical protein JOZ54_17875 [Acidobacteria bacterium]|nr:hypothetical protein [Acidobacteriota bacterium]